MRSLISLRNICRMCGERFDEDGKSVDIFEPGPDGSTYAELMKVHLDLQPQLDDGKPRTIGETCAKLLDEWTEFKKKILETQKELLKIQQRRAIVEIKLEQIEKAEMILKNIKDIGSEEEGEADEEGDVSKPSTSKASKRPKKRKNSQEGGESCNTTSMKKREIEKAEMILKNIKEMGSEVEDDAEEDINKPSTSSKTLPKKRKTSQEAGEASGTRKSKRQKSAASSKSPKYLKKKK